MEIRTCRIKKGENKCEKVKIDGLSEDLKVNVKESSNRKNVIGIGENNGE